MNVSHIGYTGWVGPLREHVPVALHNPNISTERPEGRFFGQLMSGPITKWQEDGLFYVVWSAFTYWTQTGDDRYRGGEYLRVMEEAMDWLERYCFDEQRGLFGRYHSCETPLTNSKGDGWDAAIGRPTDRYETQYKGKTVVRAYDLYINALNYSTYIMMSAMESGTKAKTYLEKADRLEENMRKFFDDEQALPSAGDLLGIDGEFIRAEPYGLDRDDYRWALSVPPFRPSMPGKYRDARNKLLEDMTAAPKGAFLCSYNAVLTSMDSEIHNEELIMQALDYLVPQSVRPGKYLPMPYTIPEIIDVEDGEAFHDVRPLVFSIAPWLSAVTNLGLRRLPFGIAVRGTKYLESIDHYEYKDALIDIEYVGEGEIGKVTLNDEVIANSYQVPESALRTGDNRMVVEMEDRATAENVLISSTVILEGISKEDGIIHYRIAAYGKNVLVFKNLIKNVVIRSASGKLVAADVQKIDGLTFFEFRGRGDFNVTVN
jgi:hypothetical protein